ncbi:hypothetical protein WR25_10145 [Diploscapter pachys]|uniref:7TM GPCR serpentine receptor class x (Srx) domain-containing protein n=1 Tax=Diploscapter pachys TaxID=2018661 RepID=A0A2A2LEZ9_9BILA|nr:hypothetical protein WR25_10145 [Diploscapter pachys]
MTALMIDVIEPLIPDSYSSIKFYITTFAWMVCHSTIGVIFVFCSDEMRKRIFKPFQIFAKKKKSLVISTTESENRKPNSMANVSS